MQKTNFKYEVIIHDDASTDNTAEIIREFEKKYPDIIKPIYQKENQYSQKVKINDTYIYPKCRGKYIAVCEGDDYWTDEYKLQKQYDLMESDEEITLCVHKARQVNLENGYESFYPNSKIKNKIVSVDDAILFGGGFFPTCSFFYRHPSKLLSNEHGYVTGDYLRIVSSAVAGKVYYMDDCMAVKTFLLPSSWAYTHRKNVSAYIKHFQELKLWLDEIDAQTNYKYSDTIKKRKLKLDFEIDRAQGNHKALVQNKYKSILNGLPFGTRIATYTRAYCPAFYKISKKAVEKIRIILQSRKR